MHCQTFQFHIWYVTVTEFQICILHQIFSKSDDFSLRYGDFTIFKMAVSAILNFMGPIMGSLKSLYKTSYKSSIETIAVNCLLFETITFLCMDFGDRQTDKQTNKQMDSINA